MLPELPLLFSAENLAFLFFAGIFTFVVAVVLFDALKKGKLAVIDVVFEIELPITVVLGIFFLHEVLTFLQFLLIAVIFSGILLIGLESLNLKKLSKNIEKGFLIGLIGAAGMGFLNFFTAFGAKEISPLMIIWVPWVVFMAVSLAVIISRKNLKRLFFNTKKFPRLILAEGILDTAAWLLFAIALSSSALSITTAITESYPALAVFLGIAINREKIVAHQYLGAVMALAGSIALALLA